MAAKTRDYRSFTLDRTSGLSAELAGKADDARLWIEKILGTKVQPPDDLQKALQDGTVLCRLIQALKPGLIKRFNESSTLKYKAIENIDFFLAACKEIGVREINLFAPVDLYENKNFLKVVRTVHFLAREVEREGVNPGIKSTSSPDWLDKKEDSTDTEESSEESYSYDEDEREEGKESTESESENEKQPQQREEDKPFVITQTSSDHSHHHPEHHQQREAAAAAANSTTSQEKSEDSSSPPETTATTETIASSTTTTTSVAPSSPRKEQQDDASKNNNTSNNNSNNNSNTNSNNTTPVASPRLVAAPKQEYRLSQETPAPPTPTPVDSPRRDDILILKQEQESKPRSSSHSEKESSSSGESDKDDRKDESSTRAETPKESPRKEEENNNNTTVITTSASSEETSTKSSKEKKSSSAQVNDEEARRAELETRIKKLSKRIDHQISTRQTLEEHIDTVKKDIQMLRSKLQEKKGKSAAATKSTSNTNSKSSKERSPVLKGYLEAKIAPSKTWERKYFVLYDNNTTAYFQNSDTQNPIEEVSLINAIVYAHVEKRGKEKPLFFNIRTSEKDLLLRAASTEEKDEWTKHFKIQCLKVDQPKLLVARGGSFLGKTLEEREKEKE